MQERSYAKESRSVAYWNRARGGAPASHTGQGGFLFRSDLYVIYYNNIKKARALGSKLSEVKKDSVGGEARPPGGVGTGRADAPEGPSVATLEEVSVCPTDPDSSRPANGSSHCLNRSKLPLQAADT